MHSQATITNGAFVTDERLPKFDIRQVRAFLFVADELHFGRAAVRLCVSQPALSRTIHALEEAIGTPLLERSTRRVKLTPAGEVFAAECKLAFGHLSRAATAAQDAADGKIGTLRIGYMDFAINGCLPNLVSGFRTQFPRDIVDLQYSSSAKLRKTLLEGRIDVGFVIGEFQSPTIANVLVEESDYVALLPDTHKLARAENVSLLALAQEPFVLGSEEDFSTFRRHLMPLCQSVGFYPNIVQEASSTTGIYGMVAAGVGVSVYAGCARNIRRVGVTVKPLVDVTETISTYAAWSPDNTSEVLRRFIEYIAGPGNPLAGKGVAAYRQAAKM